MQRNIRNEIIFASGAFIIVVFALIFAIILSGTSEIVKGETETATTQIASNTEPSEVSNTVTTQIASNTEPSSIATDIEIPSSVPSATETPIVEASETAVLPSPSNSPSPTLTLIRLEATETSPESSSTDIPNTITATVPILSPSPTMIRVASGIIPTPPPSPTVESSEDLTRIPANCLQPRGWTSYVVEIGNTLFAIALATNSTVDELRYANCIENIDNITVGEMLFVPRKPLRPIATPPPARGRDNLYIIGCNDVRVQILNLVPSQIVHDIFIVQGSASRDDFWYYKIEIRPDWAVIYNFYSRSDAPVTHGVLGDVNSEIFGEGLHWVRLSVVDLSGIIHPDAICEIPVIFG
jgi:hypothetical protein